MGLDDLINLHRLVPNLVLLGTEAQELYVLFIEHSVDRGVRFQRVLRSANDVLPPHILEERLQIIRQTVEFILVHHQMTHAEWPNARIDDLLAVTAKNSDTAYRDFGKPVDYAAPHRLLDIDGAHLYRNQQFPLDSRVVAYTGVKEHELGLLS